jgi:nitrile hydratase accessory protein
VKESELPDESALVAALPQLPSRAGRPVFYEDWQSRVFAITIQLYRNGHFSWEEWVSALDQQLKNAAGRGEPTDGPNYYRHWLTALELLTTSKGLLRFSELLTRKETLSSTNQS